MASRRNGRFLKQKHLTMSQQYSQLMIDFQESEGSFSGNESLHWIGVIRPMPCSPDYTIQIRYQTGKFPVVKVLYPKLETGNQANLPHVYSNDELCLFMPKYREWNGRMSIAKTMIPWTSLWLFNYEVWRATWKWRGGGVHPSGLTNEPVDQVLEMPDDDNVFDY